MAIAGPLYPGVFRVLTGLSNTLGMLHKPYRIKRRQRCPLNFTELKSVKDASSSVVVIPAFVVFFCPETNIMEYRRCSLFSEITQCHPFPPNSMLKRASRGRKIEVCFAYASTLSFGGRGALCDFRE